LAKNVGKPTPVPATENAALVETPRDRLALVAKGKAALRPEDLQALVATHALTADRQARNLGTRAEQLVQMLFAKLGDSIDSAATMDLIGKISRLQREAASDARRSIELLHRLSRPMATNLNVVAAGNQVAVNAQQVNANSVDWGGREPE
jgi:hypothetical protein